MPILCKNDTREQDLVSTKNMKKNINPTYITLINDSSDYNAKARQETRWATLFPQVNISFVGISSNLGTLSTLEVSGNIIDVLDAGGGKAGIIAVNVAPRGDKTEGDNGSLFAYFWYKKTLVISTIKDYNLSLVKKLNLIEHLNLLDTRQVLNFAEANNLITKQQNNYITNTQFRSFDYQPRVAHWLFQGIHLPSSNLNLAQIPEIPNTIWYIDSFGNCKTTLLKSDLLLDDKSKIKTNFGEFNIYDRLTDVPPGETAFYSGSSGLGEQRFLEIATQNRKGSAKKTLGLEIGNEIKIV